MRTSFRRFSRGTVPVVLGGVEASLRRIAHYDFLVRTASGVPSSSTPRRTSCSTAWVSTPEWSLPEDPLRQGFL
jgi:hypothetical protein